MASYVVPQVEIHQLFSEIPVALAQNQVAFVFGPNYQLHRCTNAAEMDELLVDTYDGSGTEAKSFPGSLDPEMIDTKSAKVYLRNALVQLAGLTGTFTAVKDGDAGYTKLEISTTSDSSSSSQSSGSSSQSSSSSDSDPVLARSFSGFELATAGRAPKNGDWIRVTYTAVDGGTDTLDTKINDVKLEDTKIVLFLDDGIPSGENEIAPSVTAVALCELQSFTQLEKKVDSNEQYTVGGTDKDPTIQVSANVQVLVTDKDFYGIEAGTSKYGTVLMAEGIYMSYRELITAKADTIHSVSMASEVADALGTIDPENPLAQAVYNAALNAGGQIVRYMAVPTDNLDGFKKVLEKASLTKEVYFLVPVSRDEKVIEAVQGHIENMSANPTVGHPSAKRWRVAFVSAEVPDEKAVYTKTADTSGNEFYAMGAGAGVLKLVTDDKSEDTGRGAFRKDLDKGDIVKFGTVALTYKVDEVLSNTRIRVSPVDGATPITATTDKDVVEIFHIYTNSEKAEKIRDLSSHFASRRIYNVFPSVFSNAGVVQTGEFAAACVAGLVSSCLPQQPVTNLELVGIDDIPLVYQTFSLDDLNTMASGGTFIVMQDTPNDQVYVRHQISTDYEANNLNTAELSITKNLDSISYFFDDLMTPYIGKYNITPELLAVLENVITGGLVSLEATSYGLYGPQVIAEGTEILLLEQDALLKDHVNCNLKLNLPYPFNHFVLKLFV